MLLCKLLQHSRGSWYIDEDGYLFTLHVSGKITRRIRTSGSEAFDTAQLQPWLREFFDKNFPNQRYIYPSDFKRLYNPSLAEDLSHLPIIQRKHHVRTKPTDVVIPTNQTKHTSSLIIPSLNLSFDDINSLMSWFKQHPEYEGYVVYERLMTLTK